MATINLGSIKFNWQGAYNGATAYSVDSVVSYNGSSYICKLASTGNLPTNTTYWDQMSSAGTNGTDLTSTLISQGDILYRDGSGLQRLAAGTANQVLTTGGAGANPSWSTVSSDYVKLAEFSNTTAASNFQIDNYFSSTYKFYKIIFIGQSAAGGQDFNVRVNTSTGTADTSANYRYNGTGSYRGVASGSDASIRDWNITYWHLGYGGGSVDYPTMGEIILYNPLVTTEAKQISYNIGMYNTSTDFFTNVGFGSWVQSSAITGLTFYYTSSNISFKKFNLYGIK